ncbi:MAG: glycosyltransferase [Atopobium sp.]|jgi:GT2 family glycosyltransferase|nr:glycosyltransferase [Atopobium sp.]
MADKNANSCRIAAVIVTYNRCELLLECIEHLLKQSVANMLDVLVIDNASTDNTRARLDSYIQRGDITYINTGANLGGAGGFQYGIREATERGYGWVWVMDDDCMPKDDSLEVLLKADKELDGKYGFLSSKVLWRDGSLSVMNVQRIGLGRRVRDFDSPLVPVILASFVSCFIKCRVVRELGLPIKEFFIWTDDWEYTRRISRNYPCYLVNGSVVEHKSAQNIGANVTDETPDRLNRFERMYRNDVVLYRREGVRGFFYEAARLLVHSLRVLVRSKDSKSRRLSAIWGGTKAGMSFYPTVEYCKEEDFDD